MLGGLDDFRVAAAYGVLSVAMIAIVIACVYHPMWPREGANAARRVRGTSYAVPRASRGGSSASTSSVSTTSSGSSSSGASTVSAGASVRLPLKLNLGTTGTGSRRSPSSPATSPKSGPGANFNFSSGKTPSSPMTLSTAQLASFKLKSYGSDGSTGSLSGGAVSGTFNFGTGSSGGGHDAGLRSHGGDASHKSKSVCHDATASPHAAASDGDSVDVSTARGLEKSRLVPLL